MGFCEFLFSRPLSKDSCHDILELSGYCSPIEPKDNPPMTYKIVRFHFNDEVWKPRTMKTGLTLEEAQSHCKDPETSSSTYKSVRNLAYTEQRGAWFDGYEEQK